jgi:hypothetical protein
MWHRLVAWEPEPAWIRCQASASWSVAAWPVRSGVGTMYQRA